MNRVPQDAHESTYEAVPEGDAEIVLTAEPILLKRKEMVLDRLREVTGREGVATVKEALEVGMDDASRQDILHKVTVLELELSTLRNQQLETSHASTALEEYQIRVQEDLNRQDIKERKARVVKSFIERESIAAVVGGLLLLILGVSAIIAMFTTTAIPELISGSFLVILGYFFGQASTSKPIKD